MFFTSRQKQVESLIASYCDEVRNCLDAFCATVEGYCKNPDRDQLAANSMKVHRYESHADDIRRDIEVMMFSKSLFPESRSDIMSLLEAMDRVPNHAESATRMILNQRVEIPPEYHTQMIELVEVSLRCVNAMLEATTKLFEDFTTATLIVGRIDELESAIDHIEAQMVEQVFASDLDGFSKIMLRDVIIHIAGISDRAENVGDFIRILVAKRKI